jgi:FtsX-like permease family
MGRRIDGGAMGVLWMRAKAQLRGQARASLLLALLVGLGGALVLAAAAGARRSEAALPRFLAANRTVDAHVGVQTADPADDLAEVRRQLAALPEVQQVFRTSGAPLGALILAGADPADPARWRRQLGVVALDPGGSMTFGRPILVAGRLPDERRPREAAVDEELAERRHLRIGSHYRVGAFTLQQLGPAGEGRSIPPQGAAVDLQVVGIVRYPADLLPVETNQDNLFVNTGELYLTPAYWQRYGPDIARYGIGLAVVLRHGQADLPRLTASLRRLYGDRAAVVTEGLVSGEAVTAGTRRAIRLESGALAAFALLAALAALLLVGQTLGRQILLEAFESPILRALGMTRGQLVGVAVVRAAPIALAGAALAVAGAVALSPSTPLGVARRAELHPGVAVDLPVLVIGAVAVVASMLGCAVVAGWRAARAAGGSLGVSQVPRAERPSRVAAALAAANLPPAAVIGTRLALEPGRGRSAVPVRSAIAAAAAGVCALTVAATFAASLLHLVGDPAAYGVTWDVRVGNFADPQGGRRAARKLDVNPAVAAYAGAVTEAPDVRVDGRSVHLLAYTSGKGRLPPAVVEGRAPTQPDEIALGSTALRALGKRIGDTVLIATASAAQRVQVVGRVVFNNAGLATAPAGPGNGGIVQVELWRRLSPPGAPISPAAYFVRLDPASDRRRAIARLQRDFPDTVVFPLKQPDLSNLERVGYLPRLLASLVAVLALGTVAHALITAVRRRRRDLAILKSLGFGRGQVSQTVAWQATTFALVAGLIGVPLGIAGGRWAWRLVAEQLGVAAAPVVPPLPVLAIATGALLAANLVAAGPGWVAARIQPAPVLRTE